MRFLSNFGCKIICAVSKFGISKIPTHCLKEALVTWPLSATGLLILLVRRYARYSLKELHGHFLPFLPSHVFSRPTLENEQNYVIKALHFCRAKVISKETSKHPVNSEVTFWKWSHKRDWILGFVASLAYYTAYYSLSRRPARLDGFVIVLCPLLSRRVCGGGGRGYSANIWV